MVFRLQRGADFFLLSAGVLFSLAVDRLRRTPLSIPGVAAVSVWLLRLGNHSHLPCLSVTLCDLLRSQNGAQYATAICPLGRLRRFSFPGHPTVQRCPLPADVSTGKHSG